MNLRFNLTTLGLALSLPLICHAQAGSPDQPKAFAGLFVDAINSKSAERRMALLHPKSKACINAQTQPYYDWIFSRQLKQVIPATYKVAAQPLTGKQPLPSDGKSDYPLRPWHQLQIDFDTGPYSTTSIVLLIVRDGTMVSQTLNPSYPPQNILAKLNRYTNIESRGNGKIVMPRRADQLT
ncbi:MAG: hypothetical protein ACM3TN_15515 [Alphaproteobacteria bacterium]